MMRLELETNVFLAMGLYHFPSRLPRRIKKEPREARFLGVDGRWRGSAANWQRFRVIVSVRGALGTGAQD